MYILVKTMDDSLMDNRRLILAESLVPNFYHCQKFQRSYMKLVLKILKFTGKLSQEPHYYYYSRSWRYRLFSPKPVPPVN